MDGLDTNDCSAKRYNNAATMSGVHGGVQVVIKNINEKALLNGCTSHSLNLFGHHSFG